MKVNEARQILNTIWQMKHRWIDHILKHNGLLRDITGGTVRD